jgi:hypothetical protein
MSHTVLTSDTPAFQVTSASSLTALGIKVIHFNVELLIFTQLHVQIEVFILQSYNDDKYQVDSTISTIKFWIKSIRCGSLAFTFIAAPNLSVSLDGD